MIAAQVAQVAGGAATPSPAPTPHARLVGALGRLILPCAPLTHHAEILTIEGKSYRLKEAGERQQRRTAKPAKP